MALMALSARATPRARFGLRERSFADEECLQSARRAIRNIVELRVIEVAQRGYRAGS
jgi:hypothetical protein